MRVAIIAFVIALAACSSNNNSASSTSSDPATATAQKLAAANPVTTVGIVSTFGTGDSWSKPAGLQPLSGVNATIEDDVHPIGMAIIKSGYGKLFYHTVGGFYQARIALTDKGSSGHWSCKAGGQFTYCQVPVGTVQVGEAQFGDMMGQKMVNFKCSLQLNEIGKQLGADFSTQWGDHGTVKPDAASDCHATIGPDGQPE